jgi:hypothetical protein
MINELGGEKVENYLSKQMMHVIKDGKASVKHKSCVLS